MPAFFLELAITVLFFSSSPHMFRLRMITSMVVLAPLREEAKTLPMVRLATHKPIVSVDAVVEVELLATILAGKHIATVLPNFVLAKNLQRLESFVTAITGVNPLSLSCALSPHTDPSQQQHDFPHKPFLNTCRSSGQQMSTPIHVLLKPDPCLEDNVADDPWCAYNLSRYLSCSIFRNG